MANKAPTTTAIPATTNLTRDWIDHHLVHHDLQRRIAYSVKKKWVREDIDEINSWAGLVLAHWRDSDALACYVRAGTLTVNRMKRWCKLRYQNVLFSRGCEPVHRNEGYRSEVEYLASRDAGLCPSTMSETALQSSGDDWQEVVFFEDDAGRSPLGSEIVDLDPTPEDRVEFAHDAEAALVEGRRLIVATFRDATPRYLRVFDYLYVDGLDRAEIAEKEGCTTQRVSQLSTRVRNALRDGRVIRDDAKRILSYLSGQQNQSADWSSIKEDLRIDKPRLNRAVAYLRQTGVEIEDEKDEAGRAIYALTR